MTTSYEFTAFPVHYNPTQRNSRDKGWRLGLESIFSYPTISQARKELARLQRVYKLIGRPLHWVPNLTRVERVDIPL